MTRPIAKPKPRHPNVDAALAAANDSKEPLICPCGRGRPATRSGRCRSCASALAHKTRKANRVNPPPSYGAWRHDIKLHDKVEAWDCGVCSEGGQPVWHEADELVCTQGPCPVHRPLVCGEHPQRKALSTGRCDSCAHALAYANRSPKNDGQLELGGQQASSEAAAPEITTEESPLAIDVPLTDELLLRHSHVLGDRTFVTLIVHGRTDGVLLSHFKWGPGGFFAGRRVPRGWAAVARVAVPSMDENPVLYVEPGHDCDSCGLPAIHHCVERGELLSLPGQATELSALRLCNAIRSAKEEVGFTARPARYENGGIEVIDEIRHRLALEVGRVRLACGGLHALYGDDNALADLIFALGFCGGNAMKYALRNDPSKGGQDNEKNRWYSELQAHVMEGVPDPRADRGPSFVPFLHSTPRIAQASDEYVARLPFCPVVIGDNRCPGQLSRIVGEDQAEALGAAEDGSQAVCSSCGGVVDVHSLPVFDRACLEPLTGFAGGDAGGVLVAEGQDDEDELFVERLDRLVRDPIARAALEARFGRAG